MGENPRLMASPPKPQTSWKLPSGEKAISALRSLHDQDEYKIALAALEEVGVDAVMDHSKGQVRLKVLKGARGGKQVKASPNAAVRALPEYQELARIVNEALKPQVGPKEPKKKADEGVGVGPSTASAEQESGASAPASVSTAPLSMPARRGADAAAGEQVRA